MKKNIIELYGIHVAATALQECPENIIKIVAIDAKNSPKINSLLSLARKYGISIEVRAAKRADEELAHQGIFVELKAPKHKGLSELASFLDKIADKKGKRILILDQVQDPRNLGACLRSADAAGVDCVILPEKHSAPLSSVAYKSSAGAAFYLPIFYVNNLAQSIQVLKDHNFWIYGSDLKAQKTLHNIDFADNSVIVMGSEDTGIRDLTAKSCDELFYIPMKGRVESLNVSVATGISLFFCAK